MVTARRTPATQFLVMNTDTVAILLNIREHIRSARDRAWHHLAIWGAILAALGTPSQATMVVGPWIPKFKGIDYSVSTNLPSSDLPRLQVVV